MKRFAAILIVLSLGLTQPACSGGGGDDGMMFLLLGLLLMPQPAAELAVSPGNEESTSESAAGDAVVESNDTPYSPEEDGSFQFNSDRPLPLELTVEDENGPVPGAVITVESDAEDLLFEGVSDSAGQVSTVLNLTPEVESVSVSVSSGEQMLEEFSIDNVAELASVDREIVFPGDAGGNQPAPDSDGDGMPDSRDRFPYDAERATVLVHAPFLIAYEDLYPNQGDADLNDYVILAQFTEELDASGARVKSVRASVQHVARGAGYKHTLNVSLDADATIEYAFDGAEPNEYAVPAGTTFELLPASNTTIAQSNSNAGGTYAPGKGATFTITFAAPVGRAQLGLPPYDLYAFVINTNRSIHLPGRALREDGSDPYLDADGFPWAVKLPAEWRWPLERVRVQDAYPEFAEWAASFGRTAKDWYLRPDESRVFAR